MGRARRPRCRSRWERAGHRREDGAIAAAPRIIDRRTLNRTLLQRQLLLERVRRPVYEVIEHLVAMQAQEPFDPYVGLWTRIDGFAPTELVGLLEERRAVRSNTLWRTTIHLVTDRDAPLIRALTQPLVERTFRRTQWGQLLEGATVDQVVADGRRLLAERPRTGVELGRALAGRCPGHAPQTLAMAVRWLLPTVQVPPRGVWGKSGPPTLAPLEDWLGRRLPERAEAGEIVLRYLAAFGPASVADMRNWSGLSGLREVVGRLGDRLRTYRDESGRVLYDLAEAELADPDLPAPVRFFPEYDNVFLGHADRSRVIASEVRPLVYSAFGTGGGWRGSFSVDGMLAGSWRIERRTTDRQTLVVRAYRPLDRAEQADVESEGLALLAFIAGDEIGRSVVFG